MIAGIDLSTKAIDLVAINEDNPAQCEHHRIPLNDPWWHSATSMRFRFTLNHTHNWLEQRNVYLVGIERPYGPSRQTIASLHTILGAVLATLPVHAFEISPADMRRELGLKTNCHKSTLHDAVWVAVNGPPGDQTRWHQPDPLKGWPPDAYDAWAVAHAAMKINERGTPIAA